MSFPEWGLSSGDDDTTYVTDLAHMFNSDDFAFQSYFDDGDDGVAQLGSTIPNATAPEEVSTPMRFQQPDQTTA